MPKRSNEKQFYEPLRKWLVQQGYYTGGDVEYLSGPKKGQKRYYTKTGTAQLQADVVGLRFSGNNLYSDIEICVIEVKNTRSISRQHIHQAHGYSTFAHLVYLAAPCCLGQELKNLMMHFNIGYLEINPKSKNAKVIVTPSRNEPIEKDMLHLLKNLWIGRCTICRCYFHLLDAPDKTYTVWKRRKILTDPKSLDYSNSHEKNNEIWRYLCIHCKKDFVKIKTDKI